MELKIGDVVEFRNYEDMTDDERMSIVKYYFPSSGKVKEINVNDCDRYFRIAGSKLIFSNAAVARVISDADDVDINSLNPGDEVLAKVTIGGIRENHIWASCFDKSNVVKVLKRKEPERFIVKEDYYGMYIGAALELVSDKSKAKIYTSRETAIEDAAEVLPYETFEVIPYDD